MSSVYNLEPPTKGKVVITTSLGDIDIELWAKEAPKAVRNFVQLCLEGYYNGTIFHRIIKDFMIQGGDPTGTGEGGDSIYGEYFPDEFHSRLRFNHRGLVACANASKPNTNNSQFFISLDRCDWLDKKHTIFGKVTGHTVYNLAKIAELPVDKSDRPLEPPKIVSVEVLWNPFDDIVPRTERMASGAAAGSKPQEEEQEKPKRKGTKNLALLSFGEEEEEQEEEAIPAVKMKFKSSHDALNDKRLLKSQQEPTEASLDPEEQRRKQQLKESVRQALAGGGAKGEKGTPQRGGGERREADGGSASDREDGPEEDFDARMRQQVLQRMKAMGDSKPPRPEKRQKERPVEDEGNGRDEDGSEDREEEKGRRRKVEALKIKKKSAAVGSVARAKHELASNVDLALLSPLEQQRAKYKHKRRTTASREEETLAKLAKFQGFLSTKKGAAASGSEEKEDEDAAGWVGHTLKFAKDVKKGSMDRSEDPNDYVVVDPLLEKGKEKFNKMQAKAKKRNREWGGGPGPQG